MSIPTQREDQTRTQELEKALQDTILTLEETRGKLARLPDREKVQASIEQGKVALGAS